MDHYAVCMTYEVLCMDDRHGWLVLLVLLVLLVPLVLWFTCWYTSIASIPFLHPLSFRSPTSSPFPSPTLPFSSPYCPFPLHTFPCIALSPPPSLSPHPPSLLLLSHPHPPNLTQQDIKQRLVKAGATLGIIGRCQVTSSLPPHAHVKGAPCGGRDLDTSARGLGGTREGVCVFWWCVRVCFGVSFGLGGGGESVHACVVQLVLCVHGVCV